MVDLGVLEPFLFNGVSCLQFSHVLLFAMLSNPLLPLWAGATLVVGETPSGFTPNSNNDLIVVYGQIAAINGVVVDPAGNTSPYSK